MSVYLISYLELREEEKLSPALKNQEPISWLQEKTELGMIKLTSRTAFSFT